MLFADLQQTSGSRDMAKRAQQVFIFVLCFVALVAQAEKPPAYRGGGLQVVSVREIQRGPSTDAARPPFAGPITYVALTLTDQRSGDDDWFATVHTNLSGSALAGATSPFVVAILDSGAATHLVGYPDAQAMGLQGANLTPNTFSVGGVGGMIDVDISEPVGFFAHGLQHVAGDTSPSFRTALASNQPASLVGQANFAGGVNPSFNHQAGAVVPTLLGAPFFGAFAVSIANRLPVSRRVGATSYRSPSVRFFANPSDPQLTNLQHRVFLELWPVPTPFTIGYIPDLVTFDRPGSPTAIELGSLFSTASEVFLRRGANTSSRKMIVDTAAQATLISEIAATELGINLSQPQFEVEVQGIAGSTNAPGFFVDEISVPAQGGAVVWSNVPVIVLNVGGGSIHGVFGSNLYANRDVVFNGIASPPYLELSGPDIPTTMRITGLRVTTNGMVQVDWFAEPPPNQIVLESCPDLETNGAWSAVATAEFAVAEGSLSVSGRVDRLFFRLSAP